MDVYSPKDDHRFPSIPDALRVNFNYNWTSLSPAPANIGLPCAPNVLERQPAGDCSSAATVACQHLLPMPHASTWFHIWYSCPSLSLGFCRLSLQMSLLRGQVDHGIEMHWDILYPTLSLHEVMAVALPPSRATFLSRAPVLSWSWWRHLFASRTSANIQWTASCRWL